MTEPEGELVPIPPPGAVVVIVVEADMIPSVFVLEATSSMAEGSDERRERELEMQCPNSKNLVSHFFNETRPYCQSFHQSTALI